jgi:hypothetical protein
MGLLDTLNKTAEALENKAKEISPPKPIKCPRCGSTDFIYTPKGYSKGKGLLGVAAIGCAGLVFGTSKNKVCCTCKQCSKKWEV